MSAVAYRGPKTFRAPEEPGIYAWYYCPASSSDRAARSFPERLGRIIETRYRADLSLRLRYGLRLNLSDEATVEVNGRSARSLVEDCVERGGEYFANFLRDTMTPVFARPLYVGITKNLRRRLYEEHYLGLCAYWEDNSVETYLRAHEGATVDAVQAALGLLHSFALDARVRGVPPTDLVAYGYPTADLKQWIDEDDNEENSDRIVEQVIQLLADPVCGRR